MQFFVYPHDQVIESLKRSALRDLEHQFQGIDHIQLERFILFAYEVELEELVAQIIPNSLQFCFQCSALGITSDLPADPERRCQRRTHVRDPPQAVYHPLGELIPVTSFYLHRISVADVHGEYIAQRSMIASLFAIEVKFVVIITVACKDAIGL